MTAKQSNTGKEHAPLRDSLYSLYRAKYRKMRESFRSCVPLKERDTISQYTHERRANNMSNAHDKMRSECRFAARVYITCKTYFTKHNN